MPKPLLTRLVAIYATGLFCILIGSIFAYSTHDWFFFIMSLLLFILCMIKGSILQIIIRKKRYYTVTGICQNVNHAIFQRIIKVTLKSDDQSIKNYHLDKSLHLYPGHKYCLYFKQQASMNETSKKASHNNTFSQYTEEFIGYEEIPVEEKQESLL